MRLPRNYPLLLSIAFGTLILLFVSGVHGVSAEGDVAFCRGDTVTITATLLQNGTYGTPVPSQQIEFFDQTYNEFLGLGITDSNGQADIDWSIPTNHLVGVTAINATFRGNESAALNPSCQWILVTVISSTRITVQVNQDTLAPGDLLTFTTMLLNDKDEPLANARVAVFCNTLLLQSAYTNTSGGVRFAIECNSTWAQLGTNQIRVVHDRDLSRFNEGAESIFSVSIQKLSTTMELMNPIQDSIQLNKTFCSYVLLKTNGVCLQGALLEVLLDGAAFLYTSTNESGVASVYTSIDERFSLGPHKLTLRYLGTSRLDACSLEFSLTATTPSLVRITLPEIMVIGAQAHVAVEIRDVLGRSLAGALLSLCDLDTGTTTNQSILPDATLVNLDLQVTGRKGGRSFLLTIFGNDYILNRTHVFRAVVWVRPDFILIHSDIMGYAYPGQEFMIEMRLGDLECNYTNTLIEVHIENTSVMSLHTNYSGILSLRLKAPKTTGTLAVLFTYGGNSSAYTLAAIRYYNIVVTVKMPVRIELYDYVVNSPLQQLQVRLLLRALNGSLLTGIVTNYHWLSTRGTVLSGQGGLAELFLPMPSYPGSFNLSYWIETSRSLLFSAGYTIISLSQIEVSSTEGIGMVALVISACISIAVVSIPAIRRWYLLK